MELPCLEVPSLGSRRRYRDRVEGEAVVAIVVHTTGAGPLTRWEREHERRRWRSPFDAALHIYSELMAEGPHYVIGQAPGELARVARERQVAWHVGASGAGAYRDGAWRAECPWWGARWPELEGPRDLAGGRLWLPPAGGSVVERWRARHGAANARTIGIEVVPPVEGHRAAWSDAAWSMLAAVVRDVARRHLLPLDREHVITHSDAHPLARTARGVPWDPPPSQWSWPRMAQEIGL